MVDGSRALALLLWFSGWGAAVARAEDRESPPPVSASGDPAIPEIVVHGDLLVEQARREMIHSLQQQGFTRVQRMDGYVRLRNEAAWAGEVRIYDDGWVTMKRQPVRIEAPNIRGIPKPLAWATCLVIPTGCIRAGGPLLSKRKWMGVEQRTLDSIQTDITVYGDRIADVATESTVNALPDRLAALWNSGTPLMPDERPAVNYDERKAALLEYWDSRTETVWGDRVRDAVEAFLRAEVQTSEHAFTEAEIAAFNAKRSVQRELRLSPLRDDAR